MTGMTIAVGGGVESISLVQNDKRNEYRAQDPWLVEHRPDLYMTMIETAEIVAERYQVTREAQDEYALSSQQRTAAAQAGGPPRRGDRTAARRRCGSTTARPARPRRVAVTLDKDEGNRPVDHPRRARRR